MDHFSFYASSHWEKKIKNSDLSVIVNMSFKIFNKVDFLGTICRSISDPVPFSR